MIEDTDAVVDRARARRGWRLVTAVAIVLSVVTRLSIIGWSEPWSPHQADEHLLPLDAMALWEGITPREVGWPASTTRLILSATAAVQWFAEEGRAAWQDRHVPDQALQTVTDWIGRRYVDPKPLYKLGRITSVITGVLQVAATAWAIGQWTGPEGVAIATLAAAIGPVVVLHSQYVLADITGLLFSTLLVGLAANPTRRRVIAMGALAGLGAASKFHFGLWLLTPLLCLWFRPEVCGPRRWRTAFLVMGAGAWVVLTLVPWFWVNPLLALKEFAGVVLVKVGHGAALNRVVTNAAAVYDGFGLMACFGAFLGLMRMRQGEIRRMLPLIVPVVFGTLGLLASAIVFDSYGLILLPGVLVFAACGWEAWLSSARRPARLFAAFACGGCVLITLYSLVRAERVAGEADVDVLTNQWILSNVGRGQRIAIHDEDNAFLPRTAAQLRECVNHVGTLEAYKEKWLVEGVSSTVDRAQPMRSMVLNDETYLAYWCHRELDVQQDAGYHIVPYHDGLRFGAFQERDVVSEFRNGTAAVTGGVDVLVMNRPIDVGRPPAQVLQTERGQRVIYRR